MPFSGNCAQHSWSCSSSILHASLPPRAYMRILRSDSIDAIDLMDRLRRQTGQKIVPEQFRTVRTVSDLVDTIHRLVHET